MKVLLIEDCEDQAILFMAYLNLASPDSEVTHLRDGEEAIGYLQDPHVGAVDLIFLDLRLPKVDGIDVLREYSQDTNAKNIPVIVLTSSDLVDDKIATKRLGAAAFVVKPINKNTLTHLIDSTFSA